MLILLDRTMSMHRRPDGSVPPDTADGHAQSKWHLAVTAIEAVTASLDQTIQFGLALFPAEPDADNCVTISQRINGTTAGNPQCQQGELLVAPATAASADIAASIDTEDTRLCRSTTIGAGLATVQQELTSIREADRSQFAVLVTDGQDTCDDGLVLATAHALADDGVGLYVVGFDAAGGIDHKLLNDLACAGKTAPGFPAPCTDDGSGHFVATDRNGEALYQRAESGDALAAALEAFSGQICCDCVD